MKRSTITQLTRNNTQRSGYKCAKKFCFHWCDFDVEKKLTVTMNSGTTIEHE